MSLLTERNDIHIIPRDDIELHLTDKEDYGVCWCKPKEDIADDGETVVWIHNRAKDNPQ